MAEAPSMTYVATREIVRDGVRAYAEGDLVHESAVEGEDAWLVLGEDVRPRPGASIARPARTATQAAWAAYAVSQGAKAEDAEGATRAQLIKEYGGDGPQAH